MHVRVKDNGKGFDILDVTKNKKLGSGFGLLNMRERAELIGGKLDIKSAPGEGTEMLMEVNLDFFHNQ